MMPFRKFLLSTGLLGLLLGAALAEVQSPPSGNYAEAAHLASIKDAREYQDPALLEKAWALPVARLYRSVIDYQHNGSFCGPTTVVNVLRSLHQPGDQATILQDTGIATVMGMLPGGLTLDQLAALARQKLGREVTVLRDLDLAGFREHLRHANDPARRYVINFTRLPLFGAGGGHHSPIAAYLVGEDLVFVLDVNKDYSPWLVKPERLFDAMNTLDADAGKKRGLLLIE